VRKEGKDYFESKPDDIVPYFKLLSQDFNVADKTVRIAMYNEYKKEPPSPKKQKQKTNM
jgi:hypothetical protein